jgi:hypothetical protein
MSVLVLDELYSFTWYGSVGAGQDRHKHFGMQSDVCQRACSVFEVHATAPKTLSGSIDAPKLFQPNAT